MSNEKQKLPPRFYKYQSVTTQTLANLRKRRVFFAHPSQFNDPFDCRVFPTVDEFNTEEARSFLQRYRSQNEAIRNIADAAERDPSLIDDYKELVGPGINRAVDEEMRRAFSQIGVCCFSSIKDSVLMWGHYANGHRGFCLEFRSDCELFEKATPVQYTSDVPRVALSDALDGRGLDLFRQVVATKHTQWKYEQEWRVIHLQANSPFYYEPEDLVAIYLGSEIREDDADLVAAALEGRPTSIYHYTKSDTQFALNEPGLLKDGGASRRITSPCT